MSLLLAYSILALSYSTCTYKAGLGIPSRSKARMPRPHHVPSLAANSCFLFFFFLFNSLIAYNPTVMAISQRIVVAKRAKD